MLKRFHSTRTDVLAGRSSEERARFLRSISYTDFLRQHDGLTDEAADIFVKTTHGYWGVGADSLSVAECEGAGLPMAHQLGGELPPSVQGCSTKPSRSFAVPMRKGIRC